MGLIQKIKPNADILKINNREIDISTLDQTYANKKIENAQNFPTVFIDNVIIEPNSIKNLKIDCNFFLPILTLNFEDTYNIMNDVGFVADNSKVSIIIPTNHPAFANIFIDFKITSYITGANNKISITGVINTEDLLIKDYKSYDSTSYDLFKKIAEECGLGFMSNLESSNDKMIWLNPGWNKYIFLQDTMTKTWVNETSYIYAFIDIFYNLNYVDVEQQLKEDINNIKWLNHSRLDNQDLQNNDKIIAPFLCNDNSFDTTNLFFQNEKIVNNSTEISLNRGYQKKVHFYDIDGNWQEKSGTYKEFVLDTIVNEDNENTIILKDKPGNVDFYNKNITHHYMDKLDTKNMHPDFLWATLQNTENLHELNKIAIEITLPKPNFNIKRFEKLKLIYTHKNIGASTISVRNITLNGDWLVTGYSLIWTGTAQYQLVNIIKRELTLGEL